ncbi:lipoate--protein ligase family protein [Anaplasma platys]|uniref:hypothetical protein n=1 Tax=Anaplasma platys TaxID=949 RepID=UPI00145E4117
MCVEWKTSCGLVEYSEACTTMIERVDGIIRGDQEELVWLLEHQPVYTAGTSAKPEELLDGRLYIIYSHILRIQQPVLPRHQSLYLRRYGCHEEHRHCA